MADPVLAQAKTAVTAEMTIFAIVTNCAPLAAELQHGLQQLLFGLCRLDDPGVPDANERLARACVEASQAVDMLAEVRALLDDLALTYTPATAVASALTAAATAAATPGESK